MPRRVRAALIRGVRRALQARRSSPANARPYSRRRRAAARRRDARRRWLRPAPRASGASSGAMLRQHQARLRLSPSRWAILPSLRSLTVAGVNRVAGSRSRRRGRKAANQSAKSAAGRTRAMHSASISAGDRNSSPPGSHAWQSRSSPNQSQRPVADQLAPAPGRTRSAHSSARISAKARVEMRADADRIGQHWQDSRAAARRRRGPAARAAPPRPVVVPRRLEVQVEQPGPAIGPLEPGRQRPVEIGELGRDLAGGEARRRPASAIACASGMSGNSRRSVSSVHQPWTQLCQSKLPKKIGCSARGGSASSSPSRTWSSLCGYSLRDMAERDAGKPRGDVRRRASSERQRNR